MPQEETTYRIGEVAELLNEKSYVLRYWETEFPQIAPSRTEKGQRLYTENDIALLRRIQQLLHEKGMTIDGARRILEGSAIIDETNPEKIVAVPDPEFIHMLKNELYALRKLITENSNP